VISLGVNLLRDVVKKPLSMGADELILLEDPAFVDGDSWSTAYALAAAIKKVGQFDLIFCGRQAADWDSGQVGSCIAEVLGLPQVTLAKKIEAMDGKVKVEKVTADGYEVIEVSTPALITVSNELGEPRYATIKGIMSAKRKEPIVWKPADIGVDTAKIGASDAAQRCTNFSSRYARANVKSSPARMKKTPRRNWRRNWWRSNCCNLLAGGNSLN